MSDLLYAEDLGHFWKTSKTSADAWIEKTIGLIKTHGGKPLQSMTGQDMTTGQAAFLFSFSFAGEVYKISWPVLPSKGKDERSAKIQAATLLHHIIKAKLLEAKVLGFRTAFLPFLLLEDGHTAAEMAKADLSKLFATGGLPQLPAGVDIDGEYRVI